MLRGYSWICGQKLWPSGFQSVQNVVNGDYYSKSFVCKTEPNLKRPTQPLLDIHHIHGFYSDFYWVKETSPVKTIGFSGKWQSESQIILRNRHLRMSISTSTPHLIPIWRIPRIPHQREVHQVDRYLENSHVSKTWPLEKETRCLMSRYSWNMTRYDKIIDSKCWTLTNCYLENSKSPTISPKKSWMTFSLERVLVSTCFWAMISPSLGARVANACMARTFKMDWVVSETSSTRRRQLGRWLQGKSSATDEYSRSTFAARYGSWSADFAFHHCGNDLFKTWGSSKSLSWNANHMGQ